MRGLGLLLLAQLGVTKTYNDLSAQCPDGSTPPCRARAARVPATPAPNSIAVLYFDNLSPDTADAYLADGLTEELISRLGQVDRLEVKRASRGAVARLRDTVPNYHVAAGRLLRASYLVEGSVRRSGQRVRLSARLVRTADGVHVWHEDYDRVVTDLLALEDEVARRVAIGVAGRLTRREVAAIALAPTRSQAAYEHFLRGSFYLAQRSRHGLARAMWASIAGCCGR